MNNHQLENEEDILGNFFDEDKHPAAKHTPKTKTDAVTVRRLYFLGRVISKLFQENEIPYWVTGGTLLGCVRHKGLIPWDDDIDISIMEINEGKLLQIRDILHNNGLVLMESFFGYRLFHENESRRTEASNFGLPCCDITIMRHNRKNGRIELKHESARDLWQKEFYEQEEVSSFKEMLFGDFNFTVPIDPLGYLFRFYGDDCLNVGRTQDFDHETRLNVRSVVIDTSRGFEPARPFR